MTEDLPLRRSPTRRRFLLAAAASLAAATGAGAAFAWLGRRYHGLPVKLEKLRQRLIRAAYDDLPVAAAITRHFDYLRLDPAGVERFAREYEAWLAGQRGTESVDLAFNRYLLSTDFFVHGADEGRVVRYLRFADPYRSPCGNPFIRLVGDR